MNFDDFRTTNLIKWINRSLQILFGVLLIAGINYLCLKYYFREDLTQRHLYSLSPETKAYINKIEKPLKIISTITPQTPGSLHKYVSNLLKEYEYEGKAGNSQKIEVEFVDVYKERKKAEHLARTYGLQQSDIILVASDDRQIILLPSDIMKTEENVTMAFKGEQALTSAIVELTAKRKQRIYFLGGHGEMRIDDSDPLRGLSEVVQQLHFRNFDMGVLDLSVVDKIPDDADLIIVVSPQGSIQPNEVRILKKYLNEQAGRLMIFLDPGKNHGLEDLFYEWGILVDDMLVFDNGDDFQESSGDLIIRQYADHPITETLIKNQIPLVFGLCRPVRMNPGSPLDERLQTTQLLGSSASSWAKRNYLNPKNIQELSYNPKTDLKGPISLAMIAERKISPSLGINFSGGRLLVFGNSDFITNQRIGALGNYMLFLNTINWSLDKNDLLAIQPRPIHRIQIPLSRKEVINLGLVLLILPCSTAIAGVIVYWIRKQ